MGGGGLVSGTTVNGGGNGGAGTVIIRYSGTTPLGTFSASGGTMTTSTVSGNIVHTFSGSNAGGVFTLSPRAGDLTLSGNISGTGGLWFDGTAGGDTSASRLTLSNSNSFSGKTTVDNGTLLLTNANALRESTLAAGNGTVSIGGGLTSLNIGGVDSGRTLTLTNTSGAAVTLGRVGSGTVAGVLAGLGGVTQSSGNLRLNGVNTYTGNTIIQTSSTLTLGSGASIANSGTVTVGDAGSSGARLDLSANTAYTFGTAQTVGGIGTVAGGGATTVTISGVLSPGNSPGLLTFDNADLILDSTSNTLMEITGTTLGSQYDAVVLAGGILTYGGTLTIDFGSNLFSGGTFNLFEFRDVGLEYFDTVIATGAFYSGTFTKNIVGGTGVYTLSGIGVDGGQQLKFTDVVPAGESSNYYGQLVIVPEPVTLGLLGIASGAIVIAIRRRAARIRQHAARQGNQPDSDRS
jgi:fibronectin-binding autotransporter adhesin